MPRHDILFQAIENPPDMNTIDLVEFGRLWLFRTAYVASGGLVVLAMDA